MQYVPFSLCDKYLISNTGLIFSKYTNKHLSINTNREGYSYVCLWFNKRRHNLLVHRLVATHYLNNTNKKSQVNHINGIKTDNRISNLEWSTPKENVKHSYKIGLSTGRKGIKHHNAKITENDVIQIRKMLNNGISQKDIAKKFQVNQQQISKINLKLRWGHV